MSWFGEAQWFFLVSLFVAALVTLAVYLGQYAVGLFWTRWRKSSSSYAHGEADSLLSWILSLSSWRNQWLRAWITALNVEAGKRGGSLRLAFEEDSSYQPLELSVKRVTSVVKSEASKVVSCNVVGDCIQFAIRVTRTIPANSGSQIYNVRVSPLYLNLELHMKEGDGGKIQVLWSMGNFADLNLQVQPKTKQETPGASAILETLEDILKNLMGSVRPSVDLRARPSEAKEYQNIYGVGANSQVICPPKPPRAHELKLQVKNIRAALSREDDPSGCTSAVCTAQLNDPAQKFTTVPKNTTNPSWDDEFTFELNAQSREILLQILEAEKSPDNAPWAWAAVPLDLFRKQPSGRMNFPLHCGSGGTTSGSVSAQFLYVEPNELKTWLIPAPVPAKKVEKDRTVMPCGTVVTTVTSVSSKPRVEGKNSALSSDSPARTPAITKRIERDYSVQELPSQNAAVSKALSSSDTELLMLNGSDPVAEIAIRQLRESSRQSLKSPRKKSTIIISGISKSALSQDDEVSLMLNYAATMDSTGSDGFIPSTESAPTEESAEKELSGASAPTLPAVSSDEDLHDTWELGSQPEDWTSNGLEEQDCEELSVSNLSMSETGSVKKSKGGFLKKGAKLFFRRRHQQKEPGMSQSHNDLVYLQQPGSAEHRKKGATLTRILNSKLLHKNKGKNKLQSSPPEPEH
ncbi:C2 domain-containing protein 2 [Discoglossus pictus]